MLNKLYGIIDAATAWLGAFCMGLMVLAIFIQVIWRYILNNALPWPEELARYLFLWTTYLGISMTMKDDGHLRIELIRTMTRSGVTTLIDYVCMLFNVVFFVFVVVLGTDMTMKVYSTNEMAACYPVPVYIVWIAIPLFGFLTFLQALKRLCRMTVDAFSTLVGH